MNKVRELLKAFAFVLAFLVICALCVWVAMKFDVFWILFLLIPAIVMISFLMFVHSITSLKCKGCGKEMGVKTGGLLSIWIAEKPRKCQWCGHETV